MYKRRENSNTQVINIYVNRYIHLLVYRRQRYLLYITKNTEHLHRTDGDVTKIKFK